MTTVIEVQQHNAQSRERVIEATMALGVTVDPALIQAAMMELAAIWREEAAVFVEAKRRGWKSTADGRTQAAALLAGFAVGLVPPTTSERNVVSTGTLIIPVPGDATYCARCDMDTHTCPGCGDVVVHGEVACADCTARIKAEDAEKVVIVDDPKPSTELLGGGMTAENPEQLMAFMRGETDDPGVVYAVRGGIQFPQPPDPHVCLHPEPQRSTLKSGVIMCTLCNQAVGQVEHLPALVPGSRPGPVITGDATMDYLTGAVDRYEPMSPGAAITQAVLDRKRAEHREAEHGRPQAPCFECVAIDEDPASWCDCTPQDGQPCKGPCRLLAHAYTFHPQGCTHVTKHNSLPVVCIYCGADVTEIFHPTAPKESPMQPTVFIRPDGTEIGTAMQPTAISVDPASDGGAVVGHLSPVGTTTIVGGIKFTKIGESPFGDGSEAARVVNELFPNPFTSPAAPTRNRPAVARLTYADLGPLTAATYPYPRAHLSHSYVESLSKCGLSALLSDASRAGHIAPRRPSWSLIGGNAFHVAIEGIERASIAIGGAAPTAELGAWEEFWEEALKFQIEETTAALIGSPYADPATWHIANKGLEGYDWWRVQGLDMVQRYLAHHDTAWRSTHTLLQVPVERVLTPVLELPFAVSAGSTAITMEGFIDAAWLATGPEYPTATLEVVDHKAGKSLPVDHFQLVEYGDVLRKHLPPNFALSVVGRYWRARLGTYTPPVPLPAAAGQDEIDYRYSAAERAMKHAVFAPHVDNMCSSCGAVDLCPAQSMRDGASA